MNWRFWNRFSEAFRPYARPKSPVIVWKYRNCPEQRIWLVGLPHCVSFVVYAAGRRRASGARHARNSKGLRAKFPTRGGRRELGLIDGLVLHEVWLRNGARLRLGFIFGNEKHSCWKSIWILSSGKNTHVSLLILRRQRNTHYMKLWMMWHLAVFSNYDTIILFLWS